MPSHIPAKCPFIDACNYIPYLDHMWLHEKLQQIRELVLMLPIHERCKVLALLQEIDTRLDVLSMGVDE